MRGATQTPLAVIEEDTAGKVVRIAVFLCHPEGYNRFRAFNVSPKLRGMTLRGRLWDPVSLYTHKGSLRPAYLSSASIFRSHSAPYAIKSSDFEAFIGGNSTALTAAFTGPTGDNFGKHLREWMGRMRLLHYVNAVKALVKKVGLRNGKATVAYWRSPSAAARYGPCAVSYGLLAEKVYSKNGEKETAEGATSRKNEKKETAEVARSRKDKKAAYDRERSRKKEG